MTTGVLLTCHGTVDRIEDLPGFLANIRRGRPASAAILAEVRRRFEAIGGSPLMRTTAAVARALSERLGLPVGAAGRLWRPYPAEAIAALVDAGVDRLVSLPLAPQSVHVYHAAVREAAVIHHELEVVEAPSWGLTPALIDVFLEGIDEAAGRFDAGERAGVPVILSAHSLPRRIIDGGDPYERDFRAMAAAVAARLAERGTPARVAFQSQGMDGGEWLGPDLTATFAALVAEGHRQAIVAPIGFVADHVETLYDLDIEAPELAARAGLTRVERAAAPNARPRFIDALEAVARPLL